MSAQKYSISGRPRPTGSRVDLYVWWAVRISSLALFVLALAHFSMTHFVFDPGIQSAEWVRQTRWNSITLRVLDWGMLMAVLVHGFLGMRTVMQDYVPSRIRQGSLIGLYAIALLLFVLGTQVVATLPMD
jgi:succinate dehydrogenase hydrophobic membrane anchor protein